MNLQTLGYTEPDAQAKLDTFMSRPGAILVDIRFSPRSRWKPEFNQGRLIAKYGNQYRHCMHLGNINYNKPGEPIVLRHPVAGKMMVTELLQAGHAVLLLCACKDYEKCHRKTAYELIMAALKCTLMDYHVGDSVWIRIPFVDGFLRRGTIYAISHGQWPYQVRVDDTSGAYKADELAPVSLPLDQYEEAINNGR